MADAFDLLDDAVTTDKGSITDYQTSRGELFGAGLEESLEAYNPLPLISRQMRYLDEDLKSLTGESERVDQKTAQAEVAKRGLDLKVPVGGMTRVELDSLQYLKQRELARQSTYARPRPIGGTASMLGGALAGAAVDPINVASAFIPIVPEARYAQWLARAGEGAFARAGVRAGAGAIEGAVGAAVIEPIVYAGATSEQADYSSVDSFMNVTLGGVLGGGLHSVGGAIYDRAVPPSRLRDYAGRAPDHVKRDAMQAAVEALERGDPVDVDAIFMRDIGDRYGITDQEFLGRAMDFDDAELEAARSAVVMARGGEDAKAAGWSLSTVIRNMGGIKVRGADGELTREGAEVLAMLGNHRPPGLINNKAGKTADYMREALMEDGWFRSKDSGEMDIQEFYDLLESESRGDKPQRYGETRGARLKEEAARELTDAGVTPLDSSRRASMKVAEKRARELRERADLTDGDLDFEPMELIYREPGDENALAAPQTFEELLEFEEFGGRGSRPRGLADLIPEARADRTDAAFNRQFVDQVEEIATAEKAKPKDRIEAAKVDGEDWADIVDQFREQGRVTEADDAALKQADELGAWAERRAKAFEAAASCLTVA